MARLPDWTGQIMKRLEAARLAEFGLDHRLLTTSWQQTPNRPPFGQNAADAS